MKHDECCKTCIYCEYHGNAWECGCIFSEYAGEAVDCGFICEEYEHEGKRNN